jgi:hypothetical protein
MRLGNPIRIKIANCQTKIAIAQEEDIERVAELVGQLETLKLFLDDVKERRQTVPTRLATQANELPSVQAFVNALTEEAYIRAGLVKEGREERRSEAHELDPEAEYAAFCRKLRGMHDTAAPSPDMSSDHGNKGPLLDEE